ncbi:hypothetical protein ACM16X_02500 [Haloarcula japonica]|uniref:hypothetical protein n=1 Tax=Haloarcula japonica TaxID=29282 RepID=UPI0039F6D9DD
MFEKALQFLKRLQETRENWSRRLEDAQNLLFDGQEFQVIDEDDLSDSPTTKPSSHTNQDYTETSIYEYESEKVREDVLSGKPEKRLLNQATRNGYVMSDILEDPGMVNADSQTEAVAKIAAENPSWAKISDATDTYDIDTETETGETDVETGADADTDSDMVSVDVDTDTGSVADTGNSVDGGNSVSNGNSIDGGNSL